MNHIQALQQFEALIQAPTPDALHAQLTDVVQNLGFEHYLCGLSANLNLPDPKVFALNGVSQAWWDHYQTRSCLAVDPTVRMLLREQRVIPLPWWDIRCINPSEKQFMGEAVDHGLNSGVSFSLNARHEVGVFSLILKHQPRQLRRHVSHAIPLGNLLAAYVQEAARRLMDNQGNPGSKLTRREKECLLWAASGKTAWESSVILNISERTVVFHLTNAARKLGVSNRRQAIARAIVEGLIRP